jgi:hypothetical protein
MTNNPFASNSAASRFPAIDGGLSAPQPQQGYPAGGGYQPPQQTGYFPQTQPPFQSPPRPVFPPYGQGFGLEPTPFQTQSIFGQDRTDALDTSNVHNPYGIAPSQDSGVTMQAPPPSYANVANFYSSLAQFPSAQPTRPPNAVQQIPQSPATASFGGASWNDEHPRSFVRDHKNELETWRPDAWRRFRECVEKLKQAWIGRQDLVHKAMKGYGTQWDPVDAQRVQDVSVIDRN